MYNQRRSLVLFGLVVVLVVLSHQKLPLYLSLRESHNPAHFRANAAPILHHPPSPHRVSTQFFACFDDGTAPAEDDAASLLWTAFCV